MSSSSWTLLILTLLGFCIIYIIFLERQIYKYSKFLRKMLDLLTQITVDSEIIVKKSSFDDINKE